MKAKRLMFQVFAQLLCLFICISVIHAAQIKDSESATHGDDAASSRIVDTYTFPGFKVIQFELPVLSVYSYMLISEGEALVVDPVRDAFIYSDTAKKENAVIKGVYLSHSHADFVAGHTEIVKMANCPIYQSHLSGAKYDIKAVNEQSTVNIGKAMLKFSDTPGHTPDGMCALVFAKDKPDTPLLMFSGDVLFVGSVGRPDLMEGTTSAAWLASAMFDSWTNKLSKLPDSVKVFPAHGAGSLCGAHLSDDPNSTIGRERASNSYLRHSKRSEFITALLEGLPEAPQYFKHNAKLNKEGPPPVNWNAPLPAEITPSAELSKPETGYIVDLRDAKAYSEGHIPNAINIANRGRLETWVGIMIPWGEKLTLCGTEKDLKEALYRLHRVGYSADIITLESWKKAALPITVSSPIAPRELYALMQKGQAPVVVDVRLPSEWMGLRIGNVLNLPLNHLATLSSQLDPSEPVVVVCNSAYRSSMAVGVLERKGFGKAKNLEGGSEAWIAAGLPVYEAAKSKTDPASALPKKQVKLPERISAAELKRLIMDLPGTFQLTDIRPPEMFKDYNIAGSVNADMADIISNPAYLVGAGPLILVDRDGTLAMAVGGILSQKTERPIKVLYGGLEAYWSEGESVKTQSAPKTEKSAVKAPAAPAASPEPLPAPAQEPAKPKKKSAGC
jgi:rhodanese-related sulfurtransferase/glyoxylase-like metal-dependent hydrolase (beta-lactamase superfamily II)